jgi:hypothetical protein
MPYTTPGITDPYVQHREEPSSDQRQPPQGDHINPTLEYPLAMKEGNILHKPTMPWPGLTITSRLITWAGLCRLTQESIREIPNLGQPPQPQLTAPTHPPIHTPALPVSPRPQPGSWRTARVRQYKRKMALNFARLAELKCRCHSPCDMPGAAPDTHPGRIPPTPRVAPRLNIPTCKAEERAPEQQTTQHTCTKHTRMHW